jgi:hypothetical protein
MQFGFTEGLSPNMAALILSEVCSNITAKDILFIRERPFNLKGGGEGVCLSIVCTDELREHSIDELPGLWRS